MPLSVIAIACAGVSAAGAVCRSVFPLLRGFPSSAPLPGVAAASALAAKYLACADTNRLLMVGSGALARHLVQAHSKIRPIKEVIVWSQKSTNAEKLAYEITNQTHLTASATSDLKSACEWAQLISCATLSTSPLVRGRWLSPGTHLDLVGAFNADMQETDAEAIARSNLYVDTMHGPSMLEGTCFMLRTQKISQKAILAGK